MTNVPRQIIGYWHQGRDAAPEPIKACWDLWARMNPGWDVRILEWNDIADAIAETGISADTMSFTGLSNIVRITTLAREGGVWVDAYTVPLVPLDNYVDGLNRAGFFAFHDPYRKRMAETWFLASEPGHPLAEGWRDYILAYWQMSRRPMRFKREMDRDLKGQISRLTGQVLDKVQGPISARGKKRIYQPKDPNWAVSLTGGGRYPVYPYFAFAMNFNLMMAERPELWDTWSAIPKVTSYDTLLLRHWKKQYDALTPTAVDRMCEGKLMQKLSLPTPLPSELWERLVANAEAAMPKA